MAKPPEHKFIGTKRYRLAIFRVKSRFPNGTPRLCERVPDIATVVLSDNVEENEFFTCYIPEEVLKKD